MLLLLRFALLLTLPCLCALSLVVAPSCLLLIVLFVSSSSSRPICSPFHAGPCFSLPTPCAASICRFSAPAAPCVPGRARVSVLLRGQKEWRRLLVAPGCSVRRFISQNQLSDGLKITVNGRGVSLDDTFAQLGPIEQPFVVRTGLRFRGGCACASATQEGLTPQDLRSAGHATALSGSCLAGRRSLDFLGKPSLVIKRLYRT